MGITINLGVKIENRLILIKVGAARQSPILVMFPLEILVHLAARGNRSKMNIRGSLDDFLKVSKFGQLLCKAKLSN